MMTERDIYFYSMFAGGGWLVASFMQIIFALTSPSAYYLMGQTFFISLMLIALTLFCAGSIGVAMKTPRRKKCHEDP